MSTALSLAVVIPYYQRQPGLLLACVRSVLAQQGVPPCEVIVVDDASPHPALDELAELLPANPHVRVVLQANAGPGAARNRGLDSVTPGTEFVAFLDSDDGWHPWYASDALEAFGQGCDMFFANSQRYGSEGTRFDWSQGSGWELVPTAHRPLDAERGLHLYEGDFFDFAIHRSGIISTSTLAYRFARLSTLRFNTRLFNGQDRFFKLQLAQAARCAAFSTRVSAMEGQGVNIFDSSQWGSAKGLNLLINYIRLSKLVLAEIPLTAAQQAFVRGQLAESRRNFAMTSLHLWRAGTPIPPGTLRKAFEADPATALMFLPNLMRAAARKLGRAS